jgi:hypothetical protein
MRYFSSKEGLFTASSTFDLQLPDLFEDRAGEER